MTDAPVRSIGPASTAVPRALVAGAKGFIGRHTVRAFANAGYEVHGLGHGQWPDHEKWGVKSWIGEPVSFASLENSDSHPDVIVSCVGGSTVSSSLRSPLEDFRKNVSATMEILEFARRCRPLARIIVLSSAAVYGASSRGPIGEDTPPEPLSPYGVHKWMAERACRSYAEQYGLDIAVVRLFSVYGAGLRKQLFWDACEKIQSRQMSFFGTGDETRDWIHVEDAAELILTLVADATPGLLIVNGGSGAGVPNQRLIETLASRLGYQGRVAFTSQNRRGDPEHLVANIARARALGWAPKVSLDEGIASYASWFADLASSAEATA